MSNSKQVYRSTEQLRDNFLLSAQNTDIILYQVGALNATV